MGLLDKKVQVAVNNALKPLEKELVKMAVDNAEQNKRLMLMKAAEMQKTIRGMVKEEVEKALKK